MGISANEFEIVAKTKKQGKMKGPSVKAPKFTKEMKQKLVPYGNESPQRRDRVSTKYPS